MSITENMSAAAKADLAATIARWTTGEVDVLKAVKAESKAYATYAEKSFARVVGAAYATFFAKQDGIYGGKTGDDSQTWVERFGVNSKGNATRWERLGRALVIGNLDADSDTYVTLQTRNAYAWPEVKKVLALDTFTADDITAALALDEAARTAGRKPAKTADEKKAEKAAEVEAAKREALAAMLPQDSLDLIMEMVKNLLADERTQVKHVNALERRMASAIGGYRAAADKIAS